MASERKKQYAVEVPILGQEFKVLSTSPETLPGKLLKLDLTRILRGRSIEANLIIRKEGDKLVSDFTSLKVLPSYIRRMIRKNISWVEDSFPVQGKDNIFRIKPFMITKKRVHRSVRKRLRETTKERLIKFVADKTAAEVFEAVLRGSIQRDLMGELKKIYPLSFFEIRALKIEKKQ